MVMSVSGNYGDFQSKLNAWEKKTKNPISGENKKSPLPAPKSLANSSGQIQKKVSKGSAKPEDQKIPSILERKEKLLQSSSQKAAEQPPKKDSDKTNLQKQTPFLKNTASTAESSKNKGSLDPLKAKVDLVVNNCNECIEELMGGNLQFEILQKLKDNKKLAKQIYKDPKTPIELKKSIEKILKQYDELVESFQVLRTLRGMSKELRGNETCILSNRFLQVVTLNLVNALKIEELKERYRQNKEEWRLEWKGIREKFWNIAVEASPLIKHNILAAA